MGDDAAADVSASRPRLLGSPQGHEIGDIVAVDDGIIAWLEQHYHGRQNGSARWRSAAANPILG
jgi:hypothetical protein